jgi:hypothetical protein
MVPDSNAVGVYTASLLGVLLVGVYKKAKNIIGKK